MKFVKINTLLAVREHSKPKLKVENAKSNSVDDPSKLGIDPDEQLKLDEQYSAFLNSTLTSPRTLLELPTKAYVDSLSGNHRNRRDMSTVFKNQDNEVEKKHVNNSTQYYS